MALRTLEVSQLPEAGAEGHSNSMQKDTVTVWRRDFLFGLQVTPQMLASRGFARAPGLEALPYVAWHAKNAKKGQAETNPLQC